eukprot:1148386-Prorocentrum_minimum.AAC.1
MAVAMVRFCNFPSQYNRYVGMPSVVSCCDLLYRPTNGLFHSCKACAEQIGGRSSGVLERQKLTSNILSRPLQQAMESDRKTPLD